jgi:serine/threonine-protein kinase
MLDDKYRVEQLIAFGGMGGVYVGTHIKLRKRVAIKVLNPALNSAQMVERFHREAITASQIGHEGIAGHGPGRATRASRSWSWSTLRASRRVSARRERAAGRRCVRARLRDPVAAGRRASGGIVHRDLKPDNVFLVRQSRGGW